MKWKTQNVSIEIYSIKWLTRKNKRTIIKI